ncbi:hypothetical protein SAMN04487931_110170 [Desulfobacula phenolica]|uniref:Uncharacterized protein n=1 Tax=Desulfobacula phenolica TaxID=90732 RepID=A0A1H2J534_9BACT|nr:hypothetical protein SAMN04487931_110170 [Desulfobacula phenolica]
MRTNLLFFDGETISAPAKTLNHTTFCEYGHYYKNGKRQLQ